MIDKRKRIEITLYDIFKAMRDAGYNISPSECVAEMGTLLKWANKNPSNSRNLRAEMHHHRSMGIDTEFYNKELYYIKKLEAKYGFRSLVFQTMLEAVNAVRLKSEQVESQWRKDGLAPAYNDSLRSPFSLDITDQDSNILSLDEVNDIHKTLNLPIVTQDEYEVAKEGYYMRKVFFDWIDHTDDSVIEQIKTMIKNPRIPIDKEGNKEYRYSKLSNGSSSGYRIWDRSIMDIEAMCFRLPIDTDYFNLCRYFGIANYMEDIDNYIYLDAELSQWKDATGIHTVVPDKDGKKREVYIVNWMIQSILKGVVNAWDADMRDIPGIFTYSQQDWLNHIMEFNWNRNKLIITIDMEKFSDTIYRKYIIQLLVHLGLPKKVAMELEKALDPSIYDPVLDKNMGHHKVILQGQYSVFLIMSLLNLSLQRYIICRNLQPSRPEQYSEDYSDYCCAALGDDTGMTFLKGDYKKIIEFIKKLYGSFGMKINELKSDHIENGIGQGDFAKEHFDVDGPIDHLNVRNIVNNNIDGIINDILKLKSHSMEQKELMLTSLFGADACYEIISLSTINGGLSDHPLTQEDINYYINNITRVNLVMKEKSLSEEPMVLDHLIASYKELGFGLIHSPLAEWVPIDERQILYQLPIDESNEIVKMYVLNATCIGSDINIDTLTLAIGYQPSSLKKAWERDRKRRNKSKEALIWKEFKKFDSFMAKRKMGEKGRYSSVYLPCINGTTSIMYLPHEMDNSIFKIVTDTNIHDIDSITSRYKVDRSIAILKLEGIGIANRWIGRNHICLLQIPKDETSVLQYRIHPIDSMYYTSVYPDLDEETFQEYIVPKLEKHRCEIDRISFINAIWDANKR